MASRPVFRRAWQRLADDRRGTASVEFALVGLVLILVICFILELGLTMIMESSLDEATRVASRMIRTGSVQAGGGSPAPFSSELCAKLSILMSCSGVKFNVVSGTSFASLPTAVRTDSTNQMTGTQFSPGTAGQDVVIQVAYTRPLYMPILKDLMGKDGTILMVATLAFQNEPY